MVPEMKRNPFQSFYSSEELRKIFNFHWSRFSDFTLIKCHRLWSSTPEWRNVSFFKVFRTCWACLVSSAIVFRFSSCWALICSKRICSVWASYSYEHNIAKILQRRPATQQGSPTLIAFWCSIWTVVSCIFVTSNASFAFSTDKV